MALLSPGRNGFTGFPGLRLGFNVNGIPGITGEGAGKETV